MSILAQTIHFLQYVSQLLGRVFHLLPLYLGLAGCPNPSGSLRGMSPDAGLPGRVERWLFERVSVLAGKAKGWMYRVSFPFVSHCPEMLWQV
jgi:hypothetical protein